MYTDHATGSIWILSNPAGCSNSSVPRRRYAIIQRFFFARKTHTMLTAGIYFVIRLALLQIYPAYTCFKAIKLNDHGQFLPLLIYWVSSTVFLVAEYFADLVVFW